MENTTLPQKPVLIDAPPTMEYVDPKKNRKKIIEILAVIVIICIPIVISLFKIDYSVQRVYEFVNPAVGTSPDYGAWYGIVTTAQKIIQPVVHLPTPIPTLTPTPSPASQTNWYHQMEQQSQNSDSNASSHNVIEHPEQTNEFTPPNSEEQEPTMTPTETPTLTPTETPVPLIEQQNYPNNSQVDAYAAYTACYGKKKNANCSYQSAYGETINGTCKIAPGEYLMCMAH